jgi:hypothetical protein
MRPGSGGRWRLLPSRPASLIVGLPVLLVVATAVGVALVLQPVAAWVCPACFGLEGLDRLLYVDKAMPADERKRLSTAIAEAKAHVADFYGSLLLEPVIVACSSQACDRRLGGGGEQARNFSGWKFAVIRLSPRGSNKAIIAHELSHVQAHQRVGVVNLLSGKLPAWFDEGLAVLVSGDRGILKHGQSAAEACVRTYTGEFPLNFRDWGKLAARTPTLYADAACEVARWMDANGGKAGLLAALDAVGAGTRRLP